MADLGAHLGGDTHFIDFAEEKKYESLKSAIIARKNRYKKVKYCTFSFHGAVTYVNENTYEDLKKAKELGIKSIKIYTTYDMHLNNYEILKLMEFCSKLDLVVLVHCEDDALISYSKNESLYKNKRPLEAEAIMIYTILSYGKLTGCSVYICHVSTKLGVDIIRYFKKDKALKIYAETCPQYFYFSEEVYEKEDMVKYLICPPIRDEENRKAVSHAVIDGTIDVISTDHCGFLYEKHKKGYGLNEASKGMPGIQLRSSLTYDFLYKNSVKINKLVSLLSANPSEIFNIDGYGKIIEGAKGGLTIWNNKEFTVTMDMLHEGSDYSPYENKVLKGRPYVTLKGKA